MQVYPPNRSAPHIMANILADTSVCAVAPAVQHPSPRAPQYPLGCQLLHVLLLV